jgi:hypothetical protein
MGVYFWQGKVLFVGGQAAMHERCCCILGCTSEQYGIIDPESFGWQPAPALDGTSIHGTFRFEDSANCDGPNGGPQTGYAICHVTFDVPMTVSYRVAGVTERQNAGYDTSWIKRDGNTVAEITSSEEGLGCEMADRESVFQEVVPAGQHTFEFRGSTNDGLYHVGMSHAFLVDWEPAP